MYKISHHDDDGELKVRKKVSGVLDRDQTVEICPGQAMGADVIKK